MRGTDSSRVLLGFGYLAVPIISGKVRKVMDRHLWSFKSCGQLCCAFLLALMGMSISACGMSFVPDPDDGSGELPLPDDPEPISDSIELRLLNLTSSALEAQIFVSSNGSTATPGSLFIPANLFTDRVGLAASGLIAPASSDIVEIDCVDGLVIGTDGGSFLDVETGQELGTGSQRLLQRGLVFDCDDKITLIYRFDSGGYQVDLTLE